MYAPHGTLQLAFTILFNSQGNFLLIFPHVNEAVERRVDLDSTKEMLMKQLVWEGLDAPTCDVVAVIHSEDITSDVITVMVRSLPSPLPWMPSFQTDSMPTTHLRALK